MRYSLPCQGRCDDRTARQLVTQPPEPGRREKMEVSIASFNQAPSPKDSMAFQTASTVENQVCKCTNLYQTFCTQHTALNNTTKNPDSTN